MTVGRDACNMVMLCVVVVLAFVVDAVVVVADITVVEMNLTLFLRVNPFPFL